MDVIITILLVIFVLGILIFVHELGHFLAARLVKATVLEFALGFGPKLISKEHKGTVYSIRAFPLGGFVKILGDGDPGNKKEKSLVKSDKEGNIKSKSKLQQTFVMLAGVTMNLLLAVVGYYLVLGFSNWQLALPYDFADFKPIGATMVRERDMDVPYAVLEDSFAQASGMPEEGYIVSINGEVVEYMDDIPGLIEGNDFIVIEACDFGLLCDDYIVEVGEDNKIGIAIGFNYFVNMDYSEAKVFAGFSHLVNNVRLIGSVFGNLFREARETGDYSALSHSVSGPVGIYFLVDFFRGLGPVLFISLIADLSLSLAIMNILPIPALDGGRVFILLIEGITRKDINPRLESAIINISFALLLILIVFVMIKDIVNINELKSFFE